MKEEMLQLNPYLNRDVVDGQLKGCSGLQQQMEMIQGEMQRIQQAQDNEIRGMTNDLNQAKQYEQQCVNQIGNNKKRLAIIKDEKLKLITMGNQLQLQVAQIRNSYNPYNQFWANGEINRLTQEYSARVNQFNGYQQEEQTLNAQNTQLEAQVKAQVENIGKKGVDRMNYIHRIKKIKGDFKKVFWGKTKLKKAEIPPDHISSIEEYGERIEFLRERSSMLAELPNGSPSKSTEEVNDVHSIGETLKGMFSKPNLLKDKAYRGVAFSFFKQLFVYGNNCKDVKKVRINTVNDIIYNPKAPGEEIPTLKEEVLEPLLEGVKGPETVKSIDLAIRTQSAETKSARGNFNVWSAIESVAANPKLGFVNYDPDTGRGYVPGQDVIEVYNKLLAKDISKEKVHHMVMVASQANGLESTSTNLSTLGGYLNDGTQGPTSCMQSIKGMIRRSLDHQQGKLKDKDTAKPLIDLLISKSLIVPLISESKKDIGVWAPIDSYRNKEISINVNCYPMNGKAYPIIERTRFTNGVYPFYKNGYIQPNSFTIEGRKILSNLMGELQNSYMSQECETDEGEQKHTQNFAAAISYQDFYGDRPPLIDGMEAKLPEDQKKAAYAEKNIMNFRWIYPQYNNIIKHAIIKSVELPVDNLIMVHLTKIGQGAFGNPRGIPTLAMAAAILENKEKLRGSNIVIQKEWPPQKDYEDAKVCLDQIFGMPNISEVASSYLGIQCYNAIKSIKESPGNFNFIFNERTVRIPESLS